MVQHRVGVSVVCGGLLLANILNISTLLAFVLISPSETLFFQQPLQILLGASLQIYILLISSV